MAKAKANTNAKAKAKAKAAYRTVASSPLWRWLGTV